MGMKTWLLELTPIAAMVVLQFLDVGLNTISIAAMSIGMSLIVFIVYSNAPATLISLPYAPVIGRNKRPLLTFFILCKFLLLSLVEMENLDLRNLRGLIKIISTLVLISGAMIIIYYKGPSLGTMPVSSIQHTHPPKSNKNNWVIGGLFLAIACLYNAAAFIVSFFCLFGTIQCAALALVVERDLNAWRLTPDIELISVLYSGIVGNMVTFYVYMWCIQKKGPFFVSMISPLGIAIAALMSAIFLGDALHVGSVIGTVVIVIVFYGVMWVKWNSETHEADTLQPSSNKTSLLETNATV